MREPVERLTIVPAGNRLMRLLALLILFACTTSRLRAAETAAVIVYGATPGGIAATISAARQGCGVLLVDPERHLGGLVTSGLSHTDFHSFESLTGLFLEFAGRVEATYRETYGPDSPQVRDSFRGTFGEPRTNEVVFLNFLHEFPHVRRNLGARLVDVTMSSKTGPRRITAITVLDEDGNRETLTARQFIDATYEGDLMAAAGVPWRAGREGQEEYNESLAPMKADGELQAYNFRWIMTKDPARRVTPAAPPGYRREDFAGVIDVLKSGKIERVFGYPRGCIFKAQTPPLPNGKYDINDVSTGLIRLSLPGQNLGWPDGDAATRAKIFEAHRRDQEGLLYFLQNDEAVPEPFRSEAREWGWCRDEFHRTNHLPPQLYVREARRMVGQRVFTQRDSEHAPGDARAVLHTDAIAMGDYGNNCHGTHHEGPRFGGLHGGEFYNPVPPYQIPYGTLVPKEVENLLVPVAASSSHVGFCALRLEPIWMSLGQAAGHAAWLAVEKSGTVQSVDVGELQRALHSHGSATIYVSDVLPGHADFAAVQWWGTVGGLHGLEPMPKKPGQRGPKLHGQYYEATPGHAAQLDRPLEAAVADRWTALARERRLPTDGLPAANGTTTRGDWIRTAYRLAFPPKPKPSPQPLNLNSSQPR